MTNHWVDIENAKTIMVLGANPAENHPASWGKINTARANGAKMIVADPRFTRTAASADLFLRMRSGSNGAFTMGLINYLITNNLYDARYQTETKTRFWTNDAGDKIDWTVPKWTDALFLLNAARTDYVRWDSGVGIGQPKMAASLDDPDCVFQVLKARAAHYTPAVVADICNIVGGAQAFLNFAAMIANSRGDQTVAGGLGPNKGSQFPGVILYAMGGTQSTHAAQDLRAYAMLQMLLGNMGRAGGGVNALRGIHNVQGSTDMGLLYSSVPGYSDVPLKNETTLQAAVAIGATSATIWAKLGLAADDTVRLSNGRGAAYQEDLVLASAPTGTAPGPYTITFTTAATKAHAAGKNVLNATEPVDPDAYGHYMDKLYGGPRISAAGRYWRTTELWDVGGKYHGWNLQQHGFRNMMHHYFRQSTVNPWDADYSADAGVTVGNTNFDLMPKGNGLHHIEMFLKSAETYTNFDKVKCMFIMGQNPAVTEPNTTMINAGLRGLDTLVVTDMFESETAGCDRKDAGVTYLLPSCAFAEEEGSVTNSGRWIQWRYRALAPQGKSKDDTEILLTIAKKLDMANAFSHIPLSGTYTNRYDQLYGDAAGSGYGWTPGANADVSNYNTGTIAADVAETCFKQMAHGNQTSAPFSALWIYRGGYGGWAGVGNAAAATGATNYYLAPAVLTTVDAAAGATSVTVADATSLKVGDTCYVGTEMRTISAKVGNVITLTKGLSAAWATGTQVKNVANRAKSRGSLDVGHNGAAGAHGLYSNWGWAWLKNRRVFYNNGEVSNDVADQFVAGDQVARYFVHSGIAGQSTAPSPLSYASTYRYYSTLKDANGGDGSVYTASEGAYMPKHWEPHETPNQTALAKYGKTGDAATGTIGSPTDYPLILTTIRVTEHYQGGVMTRNTPFLCELVSEPFIDINSYDAYKSGIKDGDAVYIDTARAQNVGPFKAIVGTGTGDSQKVTSGMVAIPWHWGNKGISTGATANFACIDALEMNIKMPESKACLCRIHK